MSAVIVRLPGGLSSDGVEIAVPLGDHGDYDEDTAGDVLVRPIGSSQQWERLSAVGGSMEVR